MFNKLEMHNGEMFYDHDRDIMKRGVVCDDVSVSQKWLHRDIFAANCNFF